MFDKTCITYPNNTSLMKTLPEEQKSTEQEIINKRIDAMISIIEKRNQFIVKYFETYITPNHQTSKNTEPLKEKTDQE